MPTAQGRSATTRPLCVLFDAAGRIPFLKPRRFFKKEWITIFIFYKQTSSSINKQIFIHLLDFSAVNSKFRLSSTSTSSLSLSVRKNGEEDNPSLKKSSHSMGRCHVLWFSFFVLTIDHLSSFISSFLKYVPVSHLCLDRPSCAGGVSPNLEVDQRKWEPCGNKFIFQWVFLVIPFYESTCHASFWFTIVIPSQVFPSPNCPSLYHQKGSKAISLHVICYIFKSVFIYLMVTFSWFSSMLFHGILFWLGFFPSV